MKIRFTALFIAIAISTFAFAQDGASDAAAKSAPTAEVAMDDSHSQAVLEFLKVMNVEKTNEQMIDQMLAMQVQQNPQMAAFSGIMKKFLQKHLAFEVIKGDLVKLYKDAFSEEEIKELTRFYQTPVGKKAAEKLPMLAAAGAQIGGQRVQANMGELQAAIAKKQAEMQGGSAPATE